MQVAYTSESYGSKPHHKEENMRDRLAMIFNALNNVEARGQSLLIVADCIRELQSVIQEMDKEAQDENKKD